MILMHIKIQRPDKKSSDHSASAITTFKLNRAKAINTTYEEILNVNKSKVSYFLSTFCFTVEHIEKDIDGKLFSIIERTTMCLSFP